jgi:hypothetical protein
MFDSLRGVYSGPTDFSDPQPATERDASSKWDSIFQSATGFIDSAVGAYERVRYRPRKGSDALRNRFPKQPNQMPENESFGGLTQTHFLLIAAVFVFAMYFSKK